MPCVGIKGGVQLADEQLERLSYRDGRTCCLWLHTKRPLERLFAMGVQLNGRYLPDSVPRECTLLVRGEECLSCASKAVGRLKWNRSFSPELIAHVI